MTWSETMWCTYFPVQKQHVVLLIVGIPRNISPIASSSTGTKAVTSVNITPRLTTWLAPLCMMSYVSASGLYFRTMMWIVLNLLKLYISDNLGRRLMLNKTSYTTFSNYFDGGHLVVRSDLRLLPVPCNQVQSVRVIMFIHCFLKLLLTTFISQVFNFR